ncbi:MAG: hypothetical protein HFH08_04230 [Bacilli bacterium]|nr:hypothetical protein [Bacilli bacterium]
MEHVTRPIEISELNRLMALGSAAPETDYLTYNYFSDYALLAFLLDKNGSKKIVGGDVLELKCFMREKLSEIGHPDTTYSNYSPYYIANTDMIEYSGGNKYAPDYFILKENISILDVAKRLVTIFDRRQLSTVLPPEVVKLLLSLLPCEEEKEKIYVKE